MTSDISNTTGGSPLADPAEITDGDRLGEEIGDRDLPGTRDFPPERPTGVGSTESLSGADHLDSAWDRHLREVPEGAAPAHDTVVLLDDHPSGEPDDEGQSVGEAADSVDATGPEEAAMHYEPEDDETEDDETGDDTEDDGSGGDTDGDDDRGP